MYTINKVPAIIRHVIPEPGASWKDIFPSKEAWNGTMIECSELLLRYYADQILLVRTQSDKGLRIFVSQQTGIWLDGEVGAGWGVLNSFAANAAGRQLQLDAQTSRPSFSQTDNAAVSQYKAATKESGRREIVRNIPLVVNELGISDVEFVAKLRTCEEDDLDRPGAYIGAQNGVIELDTGKLLVGEEALDKLITRSAPVLYLPDNEENIHKAWNSLPKSWEDETKKYLLAEIGHSLYGHVGRRAIVLIGPGGGGKTSILAAAKFALGPYLVGASADILMARKAEAAGHRPQFKPLLNARIAVLDEAQNLRIDRGVFKAITGDSAISHRSHHEEQRDDVFPATLFMPLNTPPRFGLDDDAIAERLRTIHIQSIPVDERQENWLEEQRQNASGWLALICRFAKEHPKQPTIPEASKTVLSEMRFDEMGEIGLWLENCCEEDEEGVITTQALWQTAASIVNQSEADELLEGFFTKRMLTSRFRSIHNLPPTIRLPQNKRGWRGYRLKIEEEKPFPFSYTDIENP